MACLTEWGLGCCEHWVGCGSGLGFLVPLFLVLGRSLGRWLCCVSVGLGLRDCGDLVFDSRLGDMQGYPSYRSRVPDAFWNVSRDNVDIMESGVWGWSRYEYHTYFIGFS